MKGIILAGGTGTRLYPMTSILNKHLLPIYDKPMIYYPMSVLMLAGIKDILIISTPEDTPNFQQMLGDGERYGIHLSYEVQPSPDGLAQAFIVGEKFIGDEPVAMILGDNLFYGSGLSERLKRAVDNAKRGKATVFGSLVKDPERFGVIEFDEKWSVVSIEEKPKKARSNFAATGLYFYDNRVVSFAKKVKPSWRNELEITDVNNMYLANGDLEAIPFSRGFTWMDMGTPESMAEASEFIRSVERQHGLKIACLEEIAYRNGWIGREALEPYAKKWENNDYGRYLLRILDSKVR
ncbi:MAG: UTP--glucose-1-phosphate uridylyltransferase AglF [Methanomassiliicoccales archaeon PtaU1.Bin124]|nr:MAG: UTP--glucose-1-phosphate uridylyltransferase AglF [Methanomassiliicoccales archaeon PtaU1.Bin124]